MQCANAVILNKPFAPIIRANTMKPLSVLLLPMMWLRWFGVMIVCISNCLTRNIITHNATGTEDCFRGLVDQMQDIGFALMGKGEVSKIDSNMDLLF